MARTTLEHRPDIKKKASPLHRALSAGASCYIEDTAPHALILDFNPLRNETKIDSTKYARTHYTAVADDLKNTYPLTVNALAPKQLLIRVEGESQKALAAWLEENKFLSITPYTEYQETTQQLPLPAKEVPSEASPRPRYRKPLEKKAAHKHITSIEPSGISLADFLTALDHEPASLFGRNDSPLTQEEAKAQLQSLHEGLMKLSPRSNVPDDPLESFKQTIVTTLAETQAERIPLLTRTLARNMLAEARMTGLVSVSKIASGAGFNITLVKGAGESHGEWQKRTEALANILAPLLQKPDEPEPQLKHHKGHIIVKMDAHSANYEAFAALASQTQQNSYML